MRRLQELLVIFALLYVATLTLNGQEKTNTAKKDSLKNKIHSWIITDKLYDRDSVEVDTLLPGFQVFNPVYKRSYANTYLGNLGLSSENNIFYRRHYESGFIFSRGYEAYMHLSLEMPYYQTRSPFTNISYSSGSSKQRLEQVFNVLHTQNVNRFFNVGFNINLLSSIGQYTWQKTKDNAFTLFTSYDKDLYSIHGNLNINNIAVRENGGIVKGSAVSGTAPEGIPVNLQDDQALSRVKNTTLFFTQRLNFVKPFNLGDSTAEDSSTVKKALRKAIPSLVHTFKLERSSRGYEDAGLDKTFYKNNYFGKGNEHDSARYVSLFNEFALELSPQKESAIPVGAKLSLTNEIKNYGYYDTLQVADTVLTPRHRKTLHETYLTVSLFDQVSEHLNWSATGGQCIEGYNFGSSYLKGEVSEKIGNRKNTIFTLEGRFERKLPDYLEKHYSSPHFMWNNSFDPVKTLSLGGSLKNRKYHFELGGNYTLLNNYIYFDSEAMPAQWAGSVSVWTAYLDKDFYLGKHICMINKAVVQKSSNETVVSLPQVSAYNSTYFQHALFNKVLNVELGVDVYYNTKYYADGYMPALSVFYRQRQEKVGDYPFVDAFLNIKLKTVRIFVKCEHLNSGYSGSGYFNACDYPMGIRTLKFGLSWLFYD